MAGKKMCIPNERSLFETLNKTSSQLMEIMKHLHKEIETKDLEITKKNQKIIKFGIIINEKTEEISSLRESNEGLVGLKTKVLETL